MKRKLLLIIVLIVSAMQTQAQDMKNHNFEVAKNLDVFNYIYKYLDLMYVDTLNSQEVIGTGIKAMLDNLDPYTEYYPESEVKNLETMLTGSYAGIGAVIKYHRTLKRVVIDEPYEGMPAALAGLKKGDIIESIDDTSMVNKNTTEVSSKLRGEPGTSFLLKIKRPSTGKLMQFKIIRRNVKVPSVPYYGLQPDSVGYISLTQFTEDCSKDVRRAVIDLKNKGAKGIMLDLRSNGGGSLDEAVKIVNMFVPKGLSIVQTRGKLKRANRDYKTDVEPIDTVMPLAVMVNGETASASEITSGSLQDLDRAVIIGSRTYGKGLVQVPVDLPYNGNLKLTTAKYYIPSGRCIQAINYKHNAKVGYAQHIPDSLTHVFYTRDGRQVRDGGGIKPDVEVPTDTMPNIVYYLVVGGNDSIEVMFDYVVDYCAKHPTIAAPSKFELSDADYADFKERVLKSGFKYDQQTDDQLKKLKELAKFEGYYDDAKDEFKALEAKLKHDVAKDLERNKKDIKRMIEDDILSCYYYQRGSVEGGLRSNKVVQETSRILKNTAEYHKLLSPKK